MTNTKAPERIWLWRDGDRDFASRPHMPYPEDAEPYVHLDLLTAAEAERDRLVERVRVITERADEVERANAQLARIALAAERAAQEARAVALQEAANLSGWWLGIAPDGQPDGAFCSVQPHDDPNVEKYVRASRILALIDTPAAETKKPDSD